MVKPRRRSICTASTSWSPRISAGIASSARRLLERGVRLRPGLERATTSSPAATGTRDEDIARDHGDMGRSMDKPAAALIKDLKSRGMLDDTIVIWTTEFGRMPCSQGGKGRDHNPFTFTSWLAGGGIKGGTIHGASDEWSYKAVVDSDQRLRPARDRPAPARHRPRTAHVSAQRDRSTPDRRPRECHQADHRVIEQLA